MRPRFGTPSIDFDDLDALMARKPPSEPPEKEWTPDTIRTGARKLQRRVDDLEAFEPEKVTNRKDPKIDTLEAAIAETLADVFGSNTGSFRRYQSARDVDTAGINMNGTPHHEVIEGLVHGRHRSIELLRGAIRSLKEKMEDDFPGESFDQVALSGRTMVAASGRAAMSGGPGILGSEARGVAGNIGVSIQNDTPTGGVLITAPPSDARYQDIQARVALLETSMSELRRELAPRATEAGIGHNRGPEFDLASPAELDDVDELIALLKEQGPKPPADTTNLIERSQKATQIAEKINQGLIAIGIEMLKGGAREAGKHMLIPAWTSVSHWITALGHTVLAWLSGI
jgi:hypothetical protein